MAGLAAAAASAGLWALITLVIKYQVVWMAVGVGFLVGWGVRLAGKGTHRVFGIMGAVLALGGCAVGNLLAIIVIAARQSDVPLPEAFMQLTPAGVYTLIAASFSPMHVFLYLVALLEGYRVSIIQHA